MGCKDNKLSSFDQHFLSICYLLHNDLFAIDDVDTLSGIADALASYVVDVAFDSLILTSYTGYVSIIAVLFPYDV